MRGLHLLLACALIPALLVAPASAISLTVAKKCLSLTMQEYPRPKGYVAYKPGDAGTAKAREEYYRRCIAKDGNI
jgi:hypothetical protein